MPTKKCFVCGVSHQIDELDLTCERCHEKELDILLLVYGFIHCFGSDFCPTATITRDLDSPGKVKPSPEFLRNWIRKGWLEANDMNSVRVPPPVMKDLKKSGFSPSPGLMGTLKKQKEESRDKPETPAPKPRTQPEQTEDSSTRRMATINRHKRG
ncbi:MAG TPA: hypothetical protein PLG59_01285 [bacterium]|nr:hypothetical protein [bacterium]HQO33263.1 hypothetical protein [bacterium]HQP99780.1 hypothetical protein [bacterium]